ncbi:cyclic nucleotide-binding domain-containing protein 2-like [Lingula anatina]|uniref:Cyclic nucleotide-binding domain-containing protein 2-like n=1 Tax=Lingula anatina TaxID=7574 RepID=A0A1S3I1B5_LINAN|nr:cyclic nucleotide-binding domain-containing protein 2-like [Lingula anatina]|eukprot:XP_013391621.1 cyclic nucleotide-binding domain-containing protein 2-like [Lingula anatina]
MVIDQAAALGIDKKDTFDPSDFKANRQLRLSTEAKRILTKRPEERTQEELTYATIALRSHKQVADYPLRMQRKLAQYGVLESYESKRVIVRQGHPPQGFYFILFGTCIVAIFAPGSEKAKTVAYLSRGESFGELSIISRDKRQSTIITKNYVELLCISATVYEQIFMVGGAKNINDPDHNDFIRSIDCLDGWPIERLQLDPKLFVFSFFKRGGVIVRDSNYSDWIIIVKSGSVQVLKKLVQVNPQVDIKTGRLIPQKIVDKTYGYTCFQVNQSEYERYLTDNEIELPSPCGGEDADDVPIADVIAEVEASNSFSPSTGAHHRDLSTYRRTQSAFSQAPVMLQTPASIKRNVKSANDKAAKVTQSLLQRRPRLANKLSAHNKKQKSVPEQVPVKTAPDDADDDLEPGFVNQKRTLFDDLDSAYKEREHIVTEADLNPQFVQVQTLTKGSVFGLANIVFDDQPSLCIVSNGAECIMINKKFYLEHCPDALMRRLRTTVSPFPSDDEMQKNLKERVNWDVYRQARLNHVVFDIQQLKMRFNYDAFISW